MAQERWNSEDYEGQPLNSDQDRGISKERTEMCSRKQHCRVKNRKINETNKPNMICVYRGLNKKAG